MSIPVFGGRKLVTALHVWRSIRPLLGGYAFDRLICLRYQPDLHREIILSWVHAQRSFGIRLGLETAWFRDSGVSPYLFSHPIDYPKQPKEGICQELDAHAEVLSRVFTRRIDPAQILPALRAVKTRAGRYLLVCPFASMRIKDVLALPVAAALRTVQERTRLPVRLCGAPEDSIRLQEFCAALLQEGIVDVEILETPSLGSFSEVIAQAGMVLAVDTASAHIAVALDKPTVVLLGGGHYGIFGPWRRSARQRWLTHPMDCFGCNWQCIHKVPYCLRSVSSEAVATALLDVWNLRDNAPDKGTLSGSRPASG
jgi:ADP-heptose:LPS heptosyltransferase